jgi:hypothetical protein
MQAFYERSKRRSGAHGMSGDIFVWTSDQSHNSCRVGLVPISGSFIRGALGSIIRSRTDRPSTDYQKKYKGPVLNTADYFEFNVKHRKTSSLSALSDCYSDDVASEFRDYNYGFAFDYSSDECFDTSSEGFSDDDSLCSVTLASVPESMDEHEDEDEDDESWTRVMEEKSDFGDSSFVLVRESPDIPTYAEILLAAAGQPPSTSVSSPISYGSPALRMPAVSPKVVAVDDQPFYEDYVQSKALRGGKPSKRFKTEGKTQRSRRYNRRY